MAHGQKPDFVFPRDGRVHLNRHELSVQSTTGRRAVHISLQGLYCSCEPVFCSHVTLTGYPLHCLVSPTLLLPCVTLCHHISKAVYNFSMFSQLPPFEIAKRWSNPCIGLDRASCFQEVEAPVSAHEGWQICHPYPPAAFPP